MTQPEIEPVSRIIGKHSTHYAKLYKETNKQPGFLVYEKSENLKRLQNLPIIDFYQ